MDLNERLAGIINQIPNLPFPCILNFLNDNSGLALYAVVGSSTETSDWAGNTQKRINYEVQIRGSGRESALLNRTLWRIALVLDNLTNIESLDHSFVFQNLTINSEPSLTDADTTGHVQYTLGFSVQILQIKERK